MAREYKKMTVIQVFAKKRKIWVDLISALPAEAEEHLERLRDRHGEENVRMKPTTRTR